MAETKIKDIPTFINTPEHVTAIVDWVSQKVSEGFQSRLYIDLEGKKLGRDGTISLMTFLASPAPGLERSYIIDIHTLGNLAFSSVGSCGKSLKDILESPAIIKVFFDVRNDSDALYSHYGIRLQGIRDLQLMENACRPYTYTRKALSGLAKCAGELMEEKPYKKDEWKLQKENGERLWNPGKGGSYDACNMRPLPEGIVAYCIGDVELLPLLYEKYLCENASWRVLVAGESQKRVTASQEAGYLPNGPGKGLNQWTLEQNRLLDEWNKGLVGQRSVNLQQDYFGPIDHNYLDTIEDILQDAAIDDGLDEYFEAIVDGIDGLLDDDPYTMDSLDEPDRACDMEDWTRMPWQGPPS